MTIHTLRGEPVNRTVWLDGHKLNPKRSQKYYNHSPDGFNWGYEGSGPAQLALAIKLELTGHADDYQAFKRQVIANIPIGQPFQIEFEL